MIYVALVALAVNAVTIITGLRLLQTQARPYTRREDVLIDKVMYLAGRTWTPPPASEPEPLERELDRFVLSPSDDLEEF